MARLQYAYRQVIGAKLLIKLSEVYRPQLTARVTLLILFRVTDKWSPFAIFVGIFSIKDYSTN